MRQKYVQCKTRAEAMKMCPWASYTLKVYLGYICFESFVDYLTAKRQK